MTFFYASVRANRDVQLNEKICPRINLTLNAHSKDTILTQEDTCRYIIYSTDGFYYIKDDCEKKIYAFSISGDELKSMSFK